MSTKAEQLARWSEVYDTQWRQLRRWIDRGDRNSDPCPLGDPSAMPAWWTRNYPGRKVPAKIDHPALDPKINLSLEKKIPVIEPPIDLASFDPAEGEELRNARRLAASIYNKLEKLPANAPNSSHLHTQYLNVCNSISVLKRRQHEDEVHLGKFVPREIYERDATAAADLLRQMHESMVRKVIELCYELTPDQSKIVSAALTSVLDTQAKIFQRLTQFTIDEDVLTGLAA